MPHRLCLMVVSWALVLLPGLTLARQGGGPGTAADAGRAGEGLHLPGGDVHALRLRLLWAAADNWHNNRARWIGLGLAAAFLGNCIYVATSRTALIVIPVLLALFALKRCTGKQIVALAVFAALLVGVAWASSPYLRTRVDPCKLKSATIFQKPFLDETSAGQRLEFWRKSLRFMAQAPLIGHGTGSVKQLFDASNVGQTGVAASVTANPHNQTLMTGIELGIVGIVVLYLMWISHLLLFRQNSLLGWIGFAVVTQNIVSSLVNSHLLDFTQGWLYVFGVGVLGGVMQAARMSDESRASAPAASTA